MSFASTLLISISAQFFLFLPFYRKWKKDCDKFGRKNLSVSLKERFIAWLVVFPVWLLPILALAK